MSIEIGFLHQLRELAPDLVPDPSHLADGLTDYAQYARQVLRSDHNQRDHAYNQKLADVEIKHCFSPTEPDAAAEEGTHTSAP